MNPVERNARNPPLIINAYLLGVKLYMRKKLNTKHFGHLFFCIAGEYLDVSLWLY